MREGEAHLIDAFGSATSFFHGANVGACFDEAGDDVDSDFNSTAAGDAVEHDGQFGRFGDGLEVLKQTFGCRLVVIRSDLEDGGCTSGFGLLCHLDGFAGGVGTGACHDDTASSSEFDREFDDPFVFLVVECGGLASGAAGDNARNAAGELVIDELFQGGFVDLTIPERGDDSGVGACEHESVGEMIRDQLSELSREGLDFDCASKGEVGGAEECDVGVLVRGRFFEADSEGVSTLNFDSDGGGSAGEFVMDEGAGDHASAAGEGFIFDAALVSADADAIGSEGLDEVGVGAFRGEGFVVAKTRAELSDIDGIDVVKEDDGVRNARVDTVNVEGVASDREGLIEFEVEGGAHVDAHLAVFELGRDHAREGFEANETQRVAMEVIDETSEAAGSVSAHFCFTAICVVVAHFEVAAFGGGFDKEETVCANAAMAVAEAGDLVSGEGEAKVTIVEHDEVIPGTVHFDKLQLHG